MPPVRRWREGKARFGLLVWPSVAKASVLIDGRCVAGMVPSSVPSPPPSCLSLACGHASASLSPPPAPRWLVSNSSLQPPGVEDHTLSQRPRVQPRGSRRGHSSCENGPWEASGCFLPPVRTLQGFQMSVPCGSLLAWLPPSCRTPSPPASPPPALSP